MSKIEPLNLSRKAKFGPQQDALQACLEHYVDAWKSEGVEWKAGGEIEYFLKDTGLNGFGQDGVRGMVVQGQRTVIAGDADSPMERLQFDKNRKALAPTLREFYANQFTDASPERKIWLSERLRVVDQLDVGHRYKDLLVLKVQDMLIGDDAFYQKPMKDYGSGFRAFKKIAGGLRETGVSIGDEELDWKGEGTEDHLYDVREWGVYEMRFAPHSPEQLADKIDATFEAYNAECEACGYSLTIKPNIHFHLSCYDTQTGEAISSASGPKPDMYRAMLDGMMTGLSEGYALYNHRNTLESPRLGVSPSHHSSVRALEDRIELRCGDMIPFQPNKQLALMLGSAWQGMKAHEAGAPIQTEIRQKPKMRWDNYLQELVAESTIIEEEGRYYAETSIKPVTRYDWFMTRPVIADLTGDKIALKALPQLPTYDFKPYQPIFDLFSRLPLVRDATSGEFRVDVKAIPDDVLKPAYKTKLESIRFNETSPTFYHPGTEKEVGNKKQHLRDFKQSDFMRQVFSPVEGLYNALAAEMERPGRKRSGVLPRTFEAQPRNISTQIE